MSVKTLSKRVDFFFDFFFLFSVVAIVPSQYHKPTSHYKDSIYEHFNKCQLIKSIIYKSIFSGYNNFGYIHQYTLEGPQLQLS